MFGIYLVSDAVTFLIIVALLYIHYCQRFAFLPVVNILWVVSISKESKLLGP